MTNARWPALQGGLLAVLSAVLFGLTTPLLKQAGEGVGPFMTAAWLYLGAATVALTGLGAAHHGAAIISIKDGRLIGQLLFDLLAQETGVDARSLVLKRADLPR